MDEDNHPHQLRKWTSPDGKTVIRLARQYPKPRYSLWFRGVKVMRSRSFGDVTNYYNAEFAL